MFVRRLVDLKVAGDSPSEELWTMSGSFGLPHGMYKADKEVEFERLHEVCCLAEKM